MNTAKPSRVLLLLCCLTAFSADALKYVVAQQPIAKNQPSQSLQEGVVEARQGHYAVAEQLLGQANMQNPNDPETLTALGKVESKLGDSIKAETLFRRVVTLRPSSATAHEDLAIVLADLNQSQAALAEADTALRLDSHLAAAEITRGRLLADLHRSTEAAKAFEDAARLRPQDPSSYFYAAQLAHSENQLNKEKELLQTVVRLDAANERALFLLGCALSTGGSEAEAREAWEKALILEPDDTEAMYRLMRSLRAQGKSEEADSLQARFKEAREKRDSLEEVTRLGNQGYVKMQAQDWQAAENEFYKALQLCGDCSLAAGLHKDLGLALCNSGDTAGGRVELSLALQLDPKDRDALRALAVIEAKHD
jgi:Flp pilus assembly protein TadD